MPGSYEAINIDELDSKRQRHPIHVQYVSLDSLFRRSSSHKDRKSGSLFLAGILCSTSTVLGGHANT